MKKLLTTLALLVSLFTFAQTEPLTTWENCAIDGGYITDGMMSNNPEIYEQILVLVIYKSKKLGYNPSSSWIHREINRQCFALKMTSQWINMVGGVKSSAYKDRVDANLASHMVFISQYQELFTDWGSLYQTEFLPKD
jgi:hypothetical protein